MCVCELWAVFWISNPHWFQLGSGSCVFKQCCGSGMFIPDPNCLHPGSRIRIEEFKYFNPKKWFLSSRKYDPGCSSRIPDPDADVLPTPDPGSGSRGQKGTGSRIRIRNTVFKLLNYCKNNNNVRAAIVSIDQSKAFDTISHVHVMLRIRIHWTRIRITIQGFDDQKMKKIELKTKIIFWSKIAIYLSLGLLRTLKLPEKPSTLKREHPALKKKNLLPLFYLLGNSTATLPSQRTSKLYAKP